MLGGKLGPEPLRLYAKPVLVELSYEELSKDPFQTPQEAQVWFRLGDQRKSAFVPLSIVDEESGTVWAVVLGEQSGEVFVSFPPTNFGQTRFFSSEINLKRIAKSHTG